MASVRIYVFFQKQQKRLENFQMIFYVIKTTEKCCGFFVNSYAVSQWTTPLLEYARVCDETNCISIFYRKFLCWFFAEYTVSFKSFIQLKNISVFSTIGAHNIFFVLSIKTKKQVDDDDDDDDEEY